MVAKVSDLQTPEQKSIARKNISPCRNEICDRRRFEKSPIPLFYMINSYNKNVAA